jgi:xanthosine utilization system XapX-like protein
MTNLRLRILGEPKGMDNGKALIYRWIIFGAYAGLGAVVVYPLLLFVPLPQFPTVLLSGSFGLLLGTASIGLYQMLAVNRKTISAQLGAVFNVVAGAAFNMMILAQLAVNQTMAKYLADASDESTKETLKRIWRVVDKVQAGLDVSWDFYICAGTFLFAINMIKHPRFGFVFGASGMAIAVLLMIFNIYTFPINPGQEGLVDLGPAVGLWYLAVVIQTFRSLRWVRGTLGESGADKP